MVTMMSTPGHHALNPSIVRVRRTAPDGSIGAVVGAGFLVAERLVCTCVHVVTDALKIDRRTAEAPSRPVALDFPFLGTAQVTGQVTGWAPDADIAILQLQADP